MGLSREWVKFHVSTLWVTGNRIDSASDNGSYVKNLPNPVPLAL
jgi:hypothetical protein